MSDIDDYVLIHGRILNSISYDLSNNYNLEIYSKGGCLQKNIESFSVAFRYPFPIGLNSAKKLFVDVMEKFYCEYNSNSDVRPYLDIYPFERSRINITIRFKGNLNTGDVNIIRNYKNEVIVEYYNDDKEKCVERMLYEDFRKSTDPVF